MTWSTMSSRRIRISSAGRCSASRASSGRTARSWPGTGRTAAYGQVDGRGGTRSSARDRRRRAVRSRHGPRDAGMRRGPRRRTSVGASSSSARSRWTRARAAHDDICDALTTWCRGRQDRSVIFGMPCLKKSGRVIAGLTRSGEGMVFKLVDEQAHARALALPGAHLFHPGGGETVFRQWVVVPPEQADEWESLAVDALRGGHAPSGRTMTPPRHRGRRTRSRPTRVRRRSSGGRPALVHQRSTTRHSSRRTATGWRLTLTGDPSKAASTRTALGAFSRRAERTAPRLRYPGPRRHLHHCTHRPRPRRRLHLTEPFLEPPAELAPAGSTSASWPPTCSASSTASMRRSMTGAGISTSFGASAACRRVSSAVDSRSATVRRQEPPPTSLPRSPLAQRPAAPPGAWRAAARAAP